MKHPQIASILCLSVIMALFNGCSKSDPQPASTPAPELLTNVSVEDGTTSPNSWVSASNNPSNTNYQFDWSTESASSGTRSLKITSTIMNGPNDGWWTQYITSGIHPGKTVQLTVKIKGTNLTKGLSGVGAYIGIGAFAGNTQTQFVSSIGVNDITGSFDFTPFTVKLPNLGPGTTSLGIYLVLGAQTTGTVYFDEVSLKELN